MGYQFSYYTVQLHSHFEIKHRFASVRLSSLRLPMPHFSYLDRVIPAELVQNPSGLCADGDEFLFI